MATENFNNPRFQRYGTTSTSLVVGGETFPERLEYLKNRAKEAVEKLRSPGLAKKTTDIITEVHSLITNIENGGADENISTFKNLESQVEVLERLADLAPQEVPKKIIPLTSPQDLFSNTAVDYSATSVRGYTPGTFVIKKPTNTADIKQGNNKTAPHTNVGGSEIRQNTALVQELQKTVQEERVARGQVENTLAQVEEELNNIQEELDTTKKLLEFRGAIAGHLFSFGTLVGVKDSLISSDTFSRLSNQQQTIIQDLDESSLQKLLEDLLNKETLDRPVEEILQGVEHEINNFEMVVNKTKALLEKEVLTENSEKINSSLTTSPEIKPVLKNNLDAHESAANSPTNPVTSGAGVLKPTHPRNIRIPMTSVDKPLNLSLVPKEEVPPEQKPDDRETFPPHQESDASTIKPEPVVQPATPTPQKEALVSIKPIQVDPVLSVVPGSEDYDHGGQKTIPPLDNSQETPVQPERVEKKLEAVAKIFNSSLYRKMLASKDWRQIIAIGVFSAVALAQSVKAGQTNFEKLTATQNDAQTPKTLGELQKLDREHWKKFIEYKPNDDEELVKNFIEDFAQNKMDVGLILKKYAPSVIGTLHEATLVSSVISDKTNNPYAILNAEDFPEFSKQERAELSFVIGNLQTITEAIKKDLRNNKKMTPEIEKITLEKNDTLSGYYSKILTLLISSTKGTLS